MLPFAGDNDDGVSEPDEVFFVNLGSAVNATVVGRPGVVTIAPAALVFDLLIANTIHTGTLVAQACGSGDGRS